MCLQITQGEYFIVGSGWGWNPRSKFLTSFIPGPHFELQSLKPHTVLNKGSFLELPQEGATGKHLYCYF